MPSSVRVNGALIRELRERRGIERWELARLVGVGKEQVYIIEVRNQRTSPTTLRRIAAALGAQPEELSLSKAEAVG